MASTVTVQIRDDIDGSEAVETVHFGLDGKEYEIDLNEVHAKELREALEPFIRHARVATTSQRRRSSRSSGDGEKKATLFSTLDPEEKDRFRAWANLPTARRISDARVQEWIDAGRP